MKMRIFVLCSIATILAMMCSMVFVTPASAGGPPVIFAESYDWPGISTVYVCPGFEVFEEYHEDLVGMTIYDKNGIPTMTHAQIDNSNILTRVDKPSVQVFVEGHYSGFWVYDETGYWYAVKGSGLGGKISIQMPGKGMLVVDAGHGYVEFGPPVFVKGTRNFYTSPEEVAAVCDYMAAQ